MSAEQLAMHRAFLDDLTARRQKLQRDLDQLAVVEEFHRQRIAELAPSQPSATSAQVLMNGGPKSPDGGAETEIEGVYRLAGTSRATACVVALRELGGQAKTEQIATWLRERDYGVDIEERIFHNVCFTAMTRNTDKFEKVGRGEWRLK